MSTSDPFNEITGLVVKGFIASQTHITDQLLEAYQTEARELRAELAAVRNGVLNAYSGPYAPSQQAIVRCLYPMAADVAQHLSDGAS